MSILVDFRRLPVSRKVSQEEAVNNLKNSIYYSKLFGNEIKDKGQFKDNLERLLLKYSVKPSSVCERELFYLDEFMNNPLGQSLILPNIKENPNGLNIDERLKYFDKLSLKVFHKFYENENVPPRSLFFITNTGFSAPNSSQRFLSEKGWLNTEAVSSFYMGCVGAFSAIRAASGLAKKKSNLESITSPRIDLVGVESNSLHFNALQGVPLRDFRLDKLISLTLFGDAAIKYSVIAESEFNKSYYDPGLKIRSSHTKIIPDTIDKVYFESGRDNFSLYLSKGIPRAVNNGIYSFVDELCKKDGIDFEKEKDNLVYAVHSGGARVIDSVRDGLYLSEDKFSIGRDVLYHNGNITSTMCPEIWRKIVYNDSIPIGSKILTVGFGPGLTMDGFIFEKVESKNV